MASVSEIALNDITCSSSDVINELFSYLVQQVKVHGLTKLSLSRLPADCHLDGNVLDQLVSKCANIR